MTAQELWAQFCKEKGINEKEEYEAWAFCDGGPAADELLQLVLEGKKFGTASLYEEYLEEGEPIPGQRDYSIILDSNENAICVIRNYEVKVEPFNRVSDYHGYSEGEEERNLIAWRRIHKDFWKEDFQRLNLDINEAQVVIEKFTLEYVIEERRKDAKGINDFFLIEPNMRYDKQIIAYRQAMLENEDSMDGCLSLKRMPNPQEWVDYSYEWGNPLREIPKNSVKGTLLMCIRKADDKLVGMIQIHDLPKDFERSYIGHIGYSVHPEERQKGYATWMLNKGLEYLKYGFGIEKAEISALIENEASKKTILKCGGKYRDQVIVEENVQLDRYIITL